MLDHIEDLRKLNKGDVNKIITIFNQSFSKAIDNPRYQSAFLFSLLIDMAQNLREINQKLSMEDLDE